MPSMNDGGIGRKDLWGGRIECSWPWWPPLAALSKPSSHFSGQNGTSWCYEIDLSSFPQDWWIGRTHQEVRRTDLDSREDEGSMMQRRLEVRCVCGIWGRLSFTGKRKNGKEICHFICSCDNPVVNFDDPYYGYHPWSDTKWDGRKSHTARLNEPSARKRQ